MNSNVSKQWLFDKYAMKAANVHGASDVFANISLRPGLRGQYGPCTALFVGIATESGLEGTYSSVDIASSSSASQPVEITEGGLSEELVDLVEVEVEVEDSDDGFRTTITRRKNDLRRPLSLEVTLRRFPVI